MLRWPLQRLLRFWLALRCAPFDCICGSAACLVMLAHLCADGLARSAEQAHSSASSVCPGCAPLSPVQMPLLRVLQTTANTVAFTL